MFSHHMAPIVTIIRAGEIPLALWWGQERAAWLFFFLSDPPTRLSLLASYPSHFQEERKKRETIKRHSNKHNNNKPEIFQREKGRKKKKTYRQIYRTPADDRSTSDFGPGVIEASQSQREWITNEANFPIYVRASSSSPPLFWPLQFRLLLLIFEAQSIGWWQSVCTFPCAPR